MMADNSRQLKTSEHDTSPSLLKVKNMYPFVAKTVYLRDARNDFFHGQGNDY